MVLSEISPRLPSAADLVVAYRTVLVVPASLVVPVVPSLAAASWADPSSVVLVDPSLAILATSSLVIVHSLVASSSAADPSLAAGTSHKVASVAAWVGHHHRVSQSRSQRQSRSGERMNQIRSGLQCYPCWH